ncbi:MAG: hypothetical protein HC945_00035 [Nitrosarchaeum sp.]|nr:hypothetical protein [Nitrosarchaeum sp.]
MENKDEKRPNCPACNSSKTRKDSVRKPCFATSKDGTAKLVENVGLIPQLETLREILKQWSQLWICT